MEIKQLVTKGALLAVRNEHGSFYVCRLEDDAVIAPRKKYKITWFEETKIKEEYILSYQDKIESETIICQITMHKINRFKYKLPKKIKRVIDSKLNAIILQEKNTNKKSIESELLNQTIEINEKNALSKAIEEEVKDILELTKIKLNHESKCLTLQNNERETVVSEVLSNPILNKQLINKKLYKGSEGGSKEHSKIVNSNERLEKLEPVTNISELVESKPNQITANEKNINEKSTEIIENDREKMLSNTEQKDSKHISELVKSELNWELTWANQRNDKSETDKSEGHEKSVNSNQRRDKQKHTTNIEMAESKLNQVTENIECNENLARASTNFTATTIHNQECKSKINVLQNIVLNDQFYTDSEEVFEDSGSEYIPSPKAKKRKQVFKKVNRSCQQKQKKKKHCKQVSGSNEQNLHGLCAEETCLNCEQNFLNFEPTEVINTTHNSLAVLKDFDIFFDSKLLDEVEKNVLDSSGNSTDKDEADYLKQLTTNSDNIESKTHSCFICHQKCIKMARHLESKHSDNLDVAKVLGKEKKTKSRRDEFIRLIRVGDFYHNMEVLTSNQGNLILSRQPKGNFKLNDYGPCPHCLGFMLKSHLWKHVRTCNKNSNVNLEKSYARSESTVLVNSIIFSGDPLFRKYILDNMRNDEITAICRTDKVIIGIGSMLYEKHGTSQNEYIRQTIRQLGRLLSELRKTRQEYAFQPLSFFIDPFYFDTVVNSVKSLCRINSKHLEKNEFGIPSLALKLGHSLKKCVSFLRGQTLRFGLLFDDQKLKSFSKLLDMEWNTKISSSALSTMEIKKMNTTQLLPLTSDLLKLNKFIIREIDIFKVLLENNPTEKEAWLRLAEATLCRIILFNKRRSGETAKLTLTQYSADPDWSSETTQELTNSLTSLEKQLAKQLKLIQIRGKRGSTVPVILTPETVLAINLLISTRYTVGVNPLNKYVFSRIHNMSLKNIRGSDALRIIVKKAVLEQPESVSSTKLRKYVATVTQILNLQENETDWLARHLGHDIKVHRQFYRLQESAVELTKLSRLLMIVDEGKVAEFKGKSLHDINLTDLPYIEEDTDEDEKENRKCADEKKSNSITSDLSTTSTSNMPTYTKNNRTRKQTNKRPWNPEETSTVCKYFRTEIKQRVVPGKKKCDLCKETNQEILKKRSWTDIKYCVKNYISKLNRSKQTLNKK